MGRVSKSTLKVRFGENLKGAYSVSIRQANREAAIIGSVDKVKIGGGTYDSYNRDALGSMNTALRQRTALAFEEAGILNAKGELTAGAVRESELISLVTKENPMGNIENKKIQKILLKDGSKIEDWHKYSTRSVKMHTGEKRQVHFYMNEKTGKIDYETIDFKVKSDVSLDPKLRSEIKK